MNDCFGRKKMIDLNGLELTIKKDVRAAKKEAWSEYLQSLLDEKKSLIELLKKAANSSPNKVHVTKLMNNLIAREEPYKRDLAAVARKALRYLLGEDTAAKNELLQWTNTFLNQEQPKYSSHLYSENENKATNVLAIKPAYDLNSEQVDGRVILRDNFDKLFGKYPEALVFGEDSGTIGDVNQGLEGLQDKYGKLRVSDTGIREATIIGQGLGMALRGLRPIAEIQYLDYIFYAMAPLTDDVATLRYRTLGKQKAPLIVRTRGHRLEGIWHSGSQMGGLIHVLRGMYILSPRNMTQAAGFYNTLMKSDEPALVIESLNGYRLKEPKPNNLETMRQGSDITLVSYGSTLRIVQKVAEELVEVGIEAEVIDAQTLLPFDINHDVLKSLQKTNRLLVVDEDVPGGCSAYILQEIVEKQGGYQFLDSAPQTLSAKAHRPAYGSDGDYFSKPNAEDIFEKVYEIMHESDPSAFPKLR